MPRLRVVLLLLAAGIAAGFLVTAAAQGAADFSAHLERQSAQLDRL